MFHLSPGSWGCLNWFFSFSSVGFGFDLQCLSWGRIMRLNNFRLLHVAFFLAVAPAAFASTTWYVNGVSGSDINNCLSATSACKTIGHAISLAGSGGTIMIAAATYTENLSIGISLNLIGSGAGTTIINGGGVNTVVTVSMGAAVTLSKLSIPHATATHVPASLHH